MKRTEAAALATLARPLSMALAALLPVAPLAAQEPGPDEEPRLYRAALDTLAAGDTTAAMAFLRELTEADPDYSPAWGLLGRILTERAGERETVFDDRLAADEALRRAWRLDPDNPRHFIALGALMRKQHMYTDSRRVLGRAEKMLREDPERVTPEERAALWYLLGLNYEDVYLDTRNLVFAPNLPVQTPECGNLGAFCLNFTRPTEFNEHFKHAANLSEEGEDDYDRMKFAFERALDAAPTHPGAFRRLAVHLVQREQLDTALALAQRYREQAPEEPWGHLTLGLIYHRQGRDSLAQESFDAGLALADPEIAGHYRDVAHLLRENVAEEYQGADVETRRWLEEVLWRKSDPLYLTDANEVQTAHLARVTFADLWFEDPEHALWGADTERGQIYIRYGPPERIWQIHRDVSREMTGEEFEMMQSSPRGGGRWIFWNYDWELPNFIFEKQPRFRYARHMASSISKAMEEEARVVEPAVYAASFELFDYPVQVARFRGAADSIVEVDLYTEIPADRLLDERDTLDLGVFLFVGQENLEVFRRVLRSPAEPEPAALTYSLPLKDGTYRYSLEARARNGDAAVGRGELAVTSFPDGVLAMSDLVLADAVTPKTTADPKDRRDFALKVNRPRRFDPDLPLAAYWELYGLATDDDGFAHYEVRVSVTDAEGKDVVARIADALGFGENDDIELSYERVVEFDGERVPEYLSIELPGREPGEYRLIVEVVDLIADVRVSGGRTFTVIPPGE